MEESSYELNEKQIEILRLLWDNNYKQNQLQKKLNLTSPGLLYHLNKLEKHHFIEKETVAQIGNAKINEIRLDPIQMQNIRRILGIKMEKCTLVSGYGELYDGYKIPDEAYALLNNKHYKIDRIVCITTRKGLDIRTSKEKEEDLVKVEKYYSEYDYEDFRNIKSEFFSDIDRILRDELRESNIVIDITPLSKLYSFEMLKRANKYNLACYYIGLDDDEQKTLLWMTNVKLKGDFGK